MRARERTPRGRRGFTLIEIMITISLVGLVMVNVWMVLRESSDAYSARTVDYDAEVQAQRTLDRICEALIGSNRDSLMIPAENPLFNSQLDFEINIGFEDGVPVFGEPQRIALEDEDRSVVWTQILGEDEERRAVWTRHVRDLLEGEVLNGEDDNGNGLVDERGLNFSLDGKMVVVRLTIERPGPNGGLVTKTLESRVTCRN